MPLKNAEHQQNDVQRPDEIRKKGKSRQLNP